MDPVDPDTVTPDPPPAAEPRRIPFLAISIALVAVMAGSALFLSGYSLGRQAATEPGTPPSQSEAFQPFWDTYHAINDRYAGGEVDRTKVVQGAIRGMIQALGDPYSAYLTSDEYRDSLLGISGQFEGIGAEIATEGPDGTEGCSPLGTHVPPGRHQADRGLAGREGGRQGRRRRGLGRWRGPRRADGRCGPGPDPRPEGLGRRPSPCARSGAPIQLTITRDVVQTKEVESRVLADGTVGYIGLAGFSDAAADDVVAALKAHLAAGRTKLILDVRGNPGGYVTAARKIASQFIASGPVFWEQDAQGNQVATEALGDGVATDRRRRRRGPDRRRQRVGQRDRRGRAPGHGACAPRRPAVVRQGHRPAVAGAERRGRCLQADHRPLADPEQALDQRHRPHARCRRDPARRHSRPAAIRHSTRRSSCWPVRRPMRRSA